jgi:cyclopropane-fatty-acyl-phospholipid synthase
VISTDRPHTRPAGDRKPLWVERRVLEQVFKAMGLSWMRVRLWDGSILQEGDGLSPTLGIERRRAMRRILANPNLGFGDGYSEGEVTVDGDLTAFLVRLFRTLGRSTNRLLPWLWGHVAGSPRLNTREQARDNIHSHYDLGNDFYALWLDERMVYTCAYYPSPDATLAEAQLAKLDHVCRKLALEPDQEVLELGCGWGALAIHMAEHYGVRVKAYNISTEQVRFASEQAERKKLTGRVEFVQDDYRAASGRYDRVVSVGMLEHVGLENYGDLGAVIDRCLSPEGLGLLHSIGRNAPRRMDPWIEKRIFPGAHPPTLSEMDGILSPHRMCVLDVENLRLHYARTCRDWRERYEAHFREVAQRFDSHFARAWRLYLAGSEAAFVSGTLQLFQVLFTRDGNQRFPWTRDHLYPSPAP